MRDYDGKRVVWYGPNDLAVGWAKDRIRDLLLDHDGMKVESIDDAIEAFQCKLTVEGAPWLFEEDDLPAMVASARSAFGAACKYVHSALGQMGIQELFESVGQQYLVEFWRLLGACGAEGLVDAQEFEDLLISQPFCFSHVLEIEKFVKRFDHEVKRALITHPRISAPLIVNRLATVQKGNAGIILPQSLKTDDVDQIMISYIHGERPGSNILDVLSRWPNSQVARYKPSSDVKIAAKRVAKAAEEEPAPIGATLKSGIGVTIDMNQKACCGMKVEGFDLTYLFGGQWLAAHLDPATILNNCIYLFSYTDNQGLVYMAGHKHEESSLMASFGLRVLGEYRTSLASTRRGYETIIQTLAYEDFLMRRGMSMEAALEWVYNTYFLDEFGIEGFGIALPSVDGTWLDRCKGIGPEIERAMKAYQIYQAHGMIEADRFPYEQFKSFSAAKSLSGEHKYLVAGAAFEQWAFHLFSDQSLLAYPQDRDVDDQCLFDLLSEQPITKESYKQPFLQGIDQLIERGLIIEDEATGRLIPTALAHCLKLIWESGAIALKLCSLSGGEIAGALVDEGVLRYCDSLFSPDEASYLNYMLNDSEATNSIGLRNKYAHANGPVEDPNSPETQWDYLAMLALLISITLKINEELMDATGKGGLDPEGLVDWPLYDASVYRAAEAAGMTERSTH